MPIAQFSGLASGIDSAALIDAVIEAREIQNQIRKTDIEGLESENDALEEFNTKILALNDLIDQFRSSNGGGIRKKAASSDPTVATATPDSSAVNSSFTLTTTSIADIATASFNDSYASLTALLAPNASGSQVVGVDVGLGGDLVSVDITIDNTTTISDYIDDFNADSNASGRVVASAVNVGTSASPDYRVVFTSLESGTQLGTIAFDVPSAGAGFGGNTDLQNRTTDQATDAIFSISGITGSITRDSNTIDDVVPGLSLQLFAVGTSDITVSDDPDSTADLMSEIVDAFNDIVEFVNENDTVTRVGSENSAKNIFGSLAKTRLDNDFLSQFRTELSTATSATGTSVTAMSELGISTNRDGTIDFDIDVFKAAVAEDGIGAREVIQDFADATAGVSGFMFQYTKFQGFIDVGQDTNNDEIDNLNEKIAQVERQSESIRESMTKRFARLEAITGELQNQQNALSGVLAGLG